MADINIHSARVGIGVGNMGEALLAALLKAGADTTKINFAVRRAERSAEISAKYGITPATIEEMAAQSDVLMIIVKPQDLETIMAKVKPTLRPDTLVISFLAAKKIATLEVGLGNPAVVRIMPNTPTLLGAGMSIVSMAKMFELIKEGMSRNFCAQLARVLKWTRYFKMLPLQQVDRDQPISSLLLRRWFLGRLHWV